MTRYLSCDGGEGSEGGARAVPSPGSREPSQSVPSVSAASGFDPSRGTCYCSFCGKSQHEVQKLIAGPTVFICDECVVLCNEICDAGKIAHTRPGISFFDLAGRLKTFCTEYKVKDEGSLALVASMCWTLGVEPSINMARSDSGGDPQGGDAVAAPGTASQNGGTIGDASPNTQSSGDPL